MYNYKRVFEDCQEKWVPDYCECGSYKVVHNGESYVCDRCGKEANVVRGGESSEGT